MTYYLKGTAIPGVALDREETFYKDMTGRVVAIHPHLDLDFPRLPILDYKMDEEGRVTEVQIASGDSASARARMIAAALGCEVVVR